MITCHCPQCDITFRHEDAEAVFCPRCKTTLCEIILETEEKDQPPPGNDFDKKAVGCGIILSILFLMLFITLGYFWWQSSRDFFTPVIVLVMLAAAPKMISSLFENHIPGCVCSEDFEMYSPVYRIVKSVSTFLYVFLAFGIFLLVLPFAIMSGPAGFLVFLGILSLLLLPALFSVFRHKGMRKILLLSILAGVISGILLIWVAFLGPLSRAMREVSSATQQQETHP